VYKKHAFICFGRRPPWSGTVSFLDNDAQLCPDLTADFHPNSNAYKSHRYASWLNQFRYNATVQIHTFTTFLHSYTWYKHNWYYWSFIHTFLEYNTGELKGPAGPTFFCRTQRSLRFLLLGPWVTIILLLVIGPGRNSGISLLVTGPWKKVPINWLHVTGN
jgi:hypothetical protein